ncbi:MAG: hypothetical protein M0Q44_01380 [Methylobacter sp.]|jgi:hypothetical protein|nr:hypothetical protein [Methylobacter sp.]
MATQFFEGKVFTDWKKADDAENKTQVEIANRQNNIVKAVGVVAETVAKKR